MTLDEIAALLECEVLVPWERATEVTTVVASDGMSEILAYHRPDALMLTGLTNVQSVRTAVVADVRAIVYVRGKRPSAQVLTLAREKGIPVMSTGCGMFESCGLLYRAGLEGAM